MRVLITGGCGFVGRHFAQHFLAQGDHVTVVDDLSSGKPPGEWLHPESPASFILHDVRDYFKYKLGGGAGSFDLILHCAAVVGGRLKIDGAPLAVATDLAIDADFFNWCVAGELPKKVIYFSSSAVYPVSLQGERVHCALAEGLVSLKADVARIGMPDSTYGWAKLTGELLMRYAVETYGLNCVAYRPFSGYGEDQALDYPFPAIIRRIVMREDPIVVWGSGRQVRDFIHIDDIVRCVVETHGKLPAGEVLNIGSGYPTSFWQLAIAASRLLGHPVDVVGDESKPQGVFRRVADVYKLGNFGFAPRVSLAEGIKRVAAHIEKGLTPPAA